MLQIENLCFGYEKEELLSHLNFSLQKGDFCALLGPNGAGKSTLLNLISGLIHPTSGQIIIDGKPISEYSSHTLAQKIAVVPQNHNMVYDFSVFDLVMMGRTPYQKRWSFGSEADRKIVNEILEKTDLLPLKERMTHQLSGGELQRTLIARAMAQQTPFILLDEPLSNLDIAHKFEIMEIIAKLNREEKQTILLVLHDLTFAIQYVPTTLLLKNGSIQHFGPTSEIITEKNVRTVFDLAQKYNWRWE